MEARLAEMSPEERAQMGARLERQLEQADQGRPVPIYRVMKKAEIPGRLVTSFNQYEPNRYIRK